MKETGVFQRMLGIAPVQPYEGLLVRCVALLPLMAGGAPNYLFTSGKPNRFNPAGVHCVYFSEDEPTARLEYARRFGMGDGACQPLGTYFASARIAKMLDLTDPATRDAIQLKPKDLTEPWQRAPKPTFTQLLGEAASERRIAAIRFSSDAARVHGLHRCNVVIFPAGLQRHDRVQILGPTREPLQTWP